MAAIGKISTMYCKVYIVCHIATHGFLNKAKNPNDSVYTRPGTP